jgi:hypothetical protein
MVLSLQFEEAEQEQDRSFIVILESNCIIIGSGNPGMHLILFHMLGM